MGIAVEYIINTGLPLLAAGEQAVADDFTSAANAVADEAVVLANDLADLGSSAVHGLTGAAIAAGEAIGGVAADGANAIAAAATVVASDVESGANAVVEQAADAVGDTFDDIGDFASNIFGRRLLLYPEQYLADLDYVEELSASPTGKLVLQEAWYLLHGKELPRVAATTHGRRHLLGVVDMYADRNPVLRRLRMHDGPQGGHRDLLGFLDVVTPVVNAIASGILYEHNSPMTTAGCPDLKVDTPYPAET